MTMYNTDYIEELLPYVGRVYIDTCSLLKAERLEKFILAAGPVFEKHNMQISVPGSVQNELIGFLNCRDCEKSELAEQVFRILDEHHELFRLEERVDSEDFADPEILSELMRNKGKFGQLLITNDRHLAEDAFQLNLQESNRGRKIMVCHLNYHGCLCRCECTKIKDLEYKDVIEAAETAAQTEIPEIIPAVRKKSARHVTDKPVVKKCRWKLPAAIAGGFAGGFVGGIAFDRYAVPAIKRVIMTAV